MFFSGMYISGIFRTRIKNFWYKKFSTSITFLNFSLFYGLEQILVSSLKLYLISVHPFRLVHNNVSFSLVGNVCKFIYILVKSLSDYIYSQHVNIVAVVVVPVFSSAFGLVLERACLASCIPDFFPFSCPFPVICSHLC